MLITNTLSVGAKKMKIVEKKQDLQDQQKMQPTLLSYKLSMMENLGPGQVGGGGLGTLSHGDARLH